MKREWHTAAELAGLPGLPKSDRNIRIKANKESWSSRKKQKGKGFEYHISSLPEQTRTYLAKQEIEKLCQTETAAIEGEQVVKNIVLKEKLEEKSKQKRKAQSLMAFNSLPGEKQTKANAKLVILKAREVYSYRALLMVSIPAAAK